MKARRWQEAWVEQRTGPSEDQASDTHAQRAARSGRARARTACTDSHAGAQRSALGSRQALAMHRKAARARKATADQKQHNSEKEAVVSSLGRERGKEKGRPGRRHSCAEGSAQEQGPCAQHAQTARQAQIAQPLSFWQAQLYLGKHPGPARQERQESCGMGICTRD